MAIVNRATSYTEMTVSGTGLRVIGYGTGPKVHRSPGSAVEVESYRNASLGDHRYLAGLCETSITCRSFPTCRPVLIFDHTQQDVAAAKQQSGATFLKDIALQLAAHRHGRQRGLEGRTLRNQSLRGNGMHFAEKN
jgi:hypothetical protein